MVLIDREERAAIQLVVLSLFYELLKTTIIWKYKAAQELERALNDMGWSPKRFAESTRFYHRTLQQELMRTIVAVIRMVGDDSYGTDLRNQASHELCKRIIDSGVLDDIYLPFI